MIFYVSRRSNSGSEAYKFVVASDGFKASVFFQTFAHRQNIDRLSLGKQMTYHSEDCCILFRVKVFRSYDVDRITQSILVQNQSSENRFFYFGCLRRHIAVNGKGLFVCHCSPCRSVCSVCGIHCKCKDKIFLTYNNSFLFVVVGFSFQNCECPIYLFDYKKPYHLMRKGHSTYCNPFANFFIHFGRKAKRSSDNKSQRSY